MSALGNARCIGVVREVYNKWERRAPLCPSHVKDLVGMGIKVIVQPSSTRVFSDRDYAQAGAEVQESLEQADVILGVKQVPIPNLLPGKTYLFFSHTIKGQRQNMDLLTAIEDKSITLIDYECITKDGKRGGERLIAFGDYAGKAGMIDTCRGIGERLLNIGYSTPFLNMGSAYMYKDLEAAKDAMSKMGDVIRTKGIPDAIAPMTFVFTGNGNVSRGAQGIFSLLPHKMVKPEELQYLRRDPYTLYGSVVTEEHTVRRKEGGKFSKAEYREFPERYEPIFHKTIAPHTSVLMNCSYWDHRFPRLLTIPQLQELWGKNDRKLLAVGDVSCDVHGSIECLSKSTYIEDPFFLYDVMQQETKSTLEGDGLLMMGVDILPSELPIESSHYFGSKLMKFIVNLLDTTKYCEFDAAKLSPELRGASITWNGVLTPGYQYIGKIREEQRRGAAQLNLAAAGSTCLHLHGHLFDSNFINKALNIIESEGGQFHIVEVDVKPNAGGFMETPSSAILQITMSDGRPALDELLQRLTELAEETPKASISVAEMKEFCQGDYSKTISRKPLGEKDEAAFSSSREFITPTVVVFGAGLVSRPVVEYLSRDLERKVVVVSSKPGEAESVCQSVGRPNVEARTADAVNDVQKMSELVNAADVVISLLPASLHIPIAKQCIRNKTPLVHASYVSPEMQALNLEAVQAGIPILCEMGLDPGMDHMSAMKIIDEIRGKGEQIISFKSVCGGLPAPEAANNPLAYKFSWSPMGVISAAQNSARYLEGGREVQVAGADLLTSANPWKNIRPLALEVIPNRDALPYADVYGIGGVKTIFRGTLRYGGWSEIMDSFKKLGLFDRADVSAASWHQLLKERGVGKGHPAYEVLAWLGLLESGASIKRVGSGTLVESFCDVLQGRLAYSKGERDMAVMHHEIISQADNGPQIIYNSSFLGFGQPNGDSVMAQTVGLSAAIGAELVLEGAFDRVGVLRPTTPDIYIPALSRLADEGLIFVESARTLTQD